MTRFAAPLLATSAALLLAAHAASLACTVESLELEDAASRAQLIVHGDVTSVRVELGADRRPLTIVEIAARAVVKGDAREKTLTLRLPGGVVDGVALRVQGMPRFVKDEQVVVLATGAHPRTGVRVPVGLAQGKWTITGRRARRDLSEVSIVDGRGRPVPKECVDVDADELLAAVRKAARAKERTAR